jgi:hypothetical protein
MRQEDRERLPIGVAPIMTIGETPVAARRGIIRHWRRCRLGGLRRDRGTRHADRRRSLCRGWCGLGRRCRGRWCLRILGAARKSSRKREQSSNGNAREMVSHLDHPVSGLFRVHAELRIGPAPCADSVARPERFVTLPEPMSRRPPSAQRRTILPVLRPPPGSPRRERHRFSRSKQTGFRSCGTCAPSERFDRHFEAVLVSMLTT